MANFKIAVTCGEPGGVGCETALKAVMEAAGLDCEFLLVGPKSVWEANLRRLDMQALPANAAVVEPEPGVAPEFAFGKITVESAQSALSAVLRAVSMAVNGNVDAIVTAPLTKEGLALAGTAEPGHTELLGRLTKSSPSMMFYSKGLKVILATTHLPLKDVASAITADLVLSKICAINGWLEDDFGLKSPRIAVLGLNPHAGENGRLGSEEETAIKPTISRAVELGINATGPYPADGLFPRANAGDFDGVVAMYHDQGLGPFKLLHFNDGVNVTLGLPIIRTSPDHGTAFDLAGRGVANHMSFLCAIELALHMARVKRDK